MARLHDRMPVILEDGDWPVWLGEEVGDHLALLRPAPALRGAALARQPGREQLPEQWGRAAGLHR